MTDTENDAYVYPGTRFSKDGLVVGQGQGMTLRDYFAAHAPKPPAWFVPSDLVEYTAGKTGRALKIAERQWSIDRLTTWRFAYADAMLEARK